MHAFLIRDCAYVLIKPLTLLYNLCLRTRTFPSVWNFSKIIPVFNTGDVYNYRAITIINNFAKIFENALQNVIYFSVCASFSPIQQGFFKG